MEIHCCTAEELDDPDKAENFKARLANEALAACCTYSARSPGLLLSPLLTVVKAGSRPPPLRLRSCRLGRSSTCSRACAGSGCRSRPPAVRRRAPSSHPSAQPQAPCSPS